ncbi:MAG: hypothetical protein QW838_02785 [Candidatus Nitrosotenuis sp.]
MKIVLGRRRERRFVYDMRREKSSSAKGEESENGKERERKASPFPLPPITPLFYPSYKF